MNYLGEIAALSTACLWAISSVVYTYMGRSIPPLFLNLSRGIIAIAFIIPTLILQGDLLPERNLKAIALLALSGGVDHGLGDTFFFESLNSIGARQTILLRSLAPPLAALFALIFLAEQLTIKNWLGIILTVFGVSWVISEGVPGSTKTKHLWRGIMCGFLAALGEASGAVLSRAALSQTDISPLWSTLLRLVASILVVLLILPAQRQGEHGIKVRLDKSLIGIILLTAFLSTFIGIWLQQIAFKYTEVGIAQALLATSPVFVLPIAILTGERVSLRAFLGVMAAIAGIVILFN